MVHAVLPFGAAPGLHGLCSSLGCMVCAAAAPSGKLGAHCFAGVPASFLGLGNCVAVPTSAELPRRPERQNTNTKHPHTTQHTHTQHSHTENDTHTDTPRMTHTQTPQARFWTQTLRKGPSGVRRARRTNTPQARLWTQTLRQGPSGVSRDRRTNTRRGRRVRRSKAHLRLAKPVERQHRE